MDKDIKKLLKEEKKKFDELINESRINPTDFIEEILPLLADYFVGNFALDGNSIICTFANGQVIRLSASDVVSV